MEDVYDFKDVFANWFFFLLFEILFFRNFYLLHCSLPRIKGLRKCMQPINGLFLMSYLPEDNGCRRQRSGRRPWADLASIYIDHWGAGPFLVGTRIRSGIPYSGIPSQLMGLQINNGRGLMHCNCVVPCDPCDQGCTKVADDAFPLWSLRWMRGDEERGAVDPKR